MIQPVELTAVHPVELHGGATATTTEVWETLVASGNGGLDRVKALAAENPALLTCQFNYTPPLHFAVRGGHEHLVRYLVANGAFDPTYRTYPFGDSLVTMAQDRGYGSIAGFLTESLTMPSVPQEKGDTGNIDYGQDEEQQQFQRAVNHNKIDEAAQLLARRPNLVFDELASWGEGILMMPAKSRNLPLLELLLSYGARVPALSKWGREYYFKHADIAAFLLDRGMSANHMTWHHVTLLHDMAQAGDIAKARLLLDHGAELDSIDDEYSSTPLGLAARWGQRTIVQLLLERGANPTKAGAPWATPLAWAETKGHSDVANDLRRAGA